jgi:carboxypeptidase C (cathepsin A)
MGRPLNDYGLVSETVDQPVGTGYSYMSTNEYLHDLPEVRWVVSF